MHLIQGIFEVKAILYMMINGTQNYLVFHKYFTKIDNKRTSPWKSKGLPDEIIKPPTKSDKSLVPALSYIGTKTRVNFDGGCLKQDKITFTPGTKVNIYLLKKQVFQFVDMMITQY